MQTRAPSSEQDDCGAADCGQGHGERAVQGGLRRSAWHPTGLTRSRGSSKCINAWSSTDHIPALSLNMQIAPDDAAYLMSCSSIAITKIGDHLVLGTMRRNIGGYPYLLCLGTSDGRLLWATKLDDNPAALVTMGATIHLNFAYIGTSSLEEARAAASSYPCCSFRGSLSKVSAVAWGAV